MREIKILQQLNNQNIVNMLEITMAPPPDKDVFIVFDYLEHDLNGLIKSELGSKLIKEDKSGIIIKGIMMQLLQGLAYLHDVAQVVHRDMKGSNILIDKHGRVKLADFGLARSIKGTGYDGSLAGSSRILPIMTNRVITLWFRPPEILLGSDTYGPEVDIWGLGCIFAELILGKTAFAGSDEVSQIEAIMAGLASEQPNPREPMKIFSNLPWFKLIPKLLQCEYNPADTVQSLRDRLKKTSIDSNGLSLLFSMLKFDPNDRITCRTALKSKYFEDCFKKDFHEKYQRAFETSSLFNSEFKSSDPIKKK